MAKNAESLWSVSGSSFDTTYQYLVSLWLIPRRWKFASARLNQAVGAVRLKVGSCTATLCATGSSEIVDFAIASMIVIVSMKNLTNGEGMSGFVYSTGAVVRLARSKKEFFKDKTIKTCLRTLSEIRWLEAARPCFALFPLCPFRVLL